MMAGQSLLSKLSEFIQVFFLLDRDGTCSPCFLPCEGYQSPLLTSETLKKHLETKCSQQDSPVICQDSLGMFFGCISLPEKNGFLLFGAVSVHSVTELSLSRFCRKYVLEKDAAVIVPVMSYTQILSLAELLHLILYGETILREQLISENQLGKEFQRSMDVELDILALDIEKQRQEETNIHHSNSEEREILRCVETGRGRDAIALSMRIDQTIGRLSSNEKVHSMKAAVVSISLCVRAAIKGGVSPDKAYQVSDFYIRRLDECANVYSITECRNHAIWDLSEAVRMHQEGHHTSYVEKCKDYIQKHYREKITLKSAAEKLGISQAYLSKIFVQWEGIPFQQYLSEFRMGKAAQMLRYGEEEIADISDQLHFSSPSYFGRVFKEHYHMTPKQYRNRYRAVE